MPDKHERLRLSVGQVDLMNEVLAGAPALILAAAERIGRGEVVPDDDAEAVANALADVMLDRDGFDGKALTARGIEIDDLIGTVQQMSELGMSMVFFRDPISRIAQRLSMRAVGEKANVNTIRALSLVLILGVASALVLLILYFVN